MKQLTIVYQIENQDHQTALLCAPNILRVSHNDSILELTKAAGLSLAQQNEIESLNRDKALLYDRLLQSEKSRKAAQIENEQLKERIARSAPVRQSLAEGEIKSLYGESNFDVTRPYVIAFARAIEAAHGITDKA